MKSCIFNKNNHSYLQGNSDGSLDEVTMSLLLALLYALEIARASKVLIKFFVNYSHADRKTFSNPCVCPNATISVITSSFFYL